jgi:hypothetical protein
MLGTITSMVSKKFGKKVKNKAKIAMNKLQEKESSDN